MKQVSATVISNNEVMPETHLIWLDCPEIAAEARPGQFVMVNCGEDTLLPRPLSIHGREEGKITLLVNVVGKGTDWLAQCQSGESLKIFGPLGNGFSLYPDSDNLLLVAGGLGIAPLRFLIDEALEQDKEVTLLYGAQTKVQLLPKATSSRVLLTNEMLPFAVTVHKCTEDGSTGYHGLVTDLLPKFTDKADQVFACGPLPMYRDMARRKKELGLEGKNIQVSLEVRMACGRGLCYGCSVKTKQGQKKVCDDGPVFYIDDILWDELVLL